MRSVLIIVCLLFGLQAFCLDGKELIQKMQSFYRSNERIEYTTRYQLFKGHRSTNVETQYEGYNFKDGSNFYQRIKQTEFVYGKEFFLRINSEDQTLEYDHALPFWSNGADFEKAMNECREVKVEESENTYTVILLFKITSQSDFSVMRIKMDKTDYHLVQLDFYYSARQDFSTERTVKDLHQPHLRILFENLRTDVEKKDKLFRISSYLAETGHFLKPVGKYSEFELIDNRLN